MCSREIFDYLQTGLEIGFFVAKSDLPGPLPKCFAIGENEFLSLCLTGPTWRAIMKKKKGLEGSQVGVVKDDYLVRVPELKRD